MGDKRSLQLKKLFWCCLKRSHTIKGFSTTVSKANKFLWMQKRDKTSSRYGNCMAAVMCHCISALLSNKELKISIPTEVTERVPPDRHSKQAGNGPLPSVATHILLGDIAGVGKGGDNHLYSKEKHHTQDQHTFFECLFLHERQKNC